MSKAKESSMVSLILSSLALYGSLAGAQDLDRDKARREMALRAVEVGTVQEARNTFFHLMDEGKIVRRSINCRGLAYSSA